MQHAIHSRPRLLVACAASLAAIGPGWAREPATAAGADLVEYGRRLFTEETFGGNGRVCSTCHELDRFGTITPEYVQALYEKDPGAPLFRAIDSDDGSGASYERLQQFATIRIPIELPTRTASGLGIRKCDDPANTHVVVFRGNPSVYNVALERHLMVDGRNGADLERQAFDAVHTHAGPGREPTPEELAAIAAFQASLFSRDGLRELTSAVYAARIAESDAAPDWLPAPRTPGEARGRAFFARNRQCGLCHSGPMMNRTSRSHPNGVGLSIESSFVGLEPDNPNERFMWCYVDLETNEIVPGPLGVPEVFPSPVADPGLGLIAGLQEFQAADGTPELIANEILDGVAGPAFKIPTLWGTPDTAPYFHDNSAKDLREVIDHYNFLFTLLPDFAKRTGCHPAPADCLSERDEDDIVAFMQRLSFDDPTGRSRVEDPPGPRSVALAK